MDRRRFVHQNAVFWGMGLLCPIIHPDFLYEINEVYDVIIVGAGLSGLQAARILSDGGLKVCLLEADERIGGRVQTKKLPNHGYVELGGQWIGKTHTTVLNILKENQIGYFPTYTQGKSLLSYTSKIKAYQGLFPSIPFQSLWEFVRLSSSFEKLAKKINLNAPHESPDAKGLDETTVKSWIENNSTNALAIQLMEGSLEALFCCELSQTSMLQALLAVKSNGSLEFMLATKGGAQEYRISGGASQICQALANKIKGKIHLQSPVKQVVQIGEQVWVKTEKETFKASKVILTVPFPVTKEIEFQPALPIEKQMVMEKMFMASVIKFNVIYKKPFWRESKMNGMSFNLDGYIGSTFDNSVPGDTEGVLVAFVHGNNAKKIGKLSETERKELIIKELGFLFGKEATSPLEIVEYDYSKNKWVKGAYAGIFPPQVISIYGNEAQKPFGNIHWAGTETAVRCKGYMEGALVAGERAALEVKTALEKDKKP